VKQDCGGTLSPILARGVCQGFCTPRTPQTNRLSKRETEFKLRTRNEKEGCLQMSFWIFFHFMGTFIESSVSHSRKD
jgi:hypothetical protein